MSSYINISDKKKKQREAYKKKIRMRSIKAMRAKNTCRTKLQQTGSSRRVEKNRFAAFAIGKASKGRRKIKTPF